MNDYDFYSVRFFKFCRRVLRITVGHVAILGLYLNGYHINLNGHYFEHFKMAGHFDMTLAIDMAEALKKWHRRREVQFES